jgi:hypothetical protein
MFSFIVGALVKFLFGQFYTANVPKLSTVRTFNGRAVFPVDFAAEAPPLGTIFTNLYGVCFHIVYILLYFL